MCTIVDDCIQIAESVTAQFTSGCRERGFELNGGSLDDGFGGFGDAGEHLALLSLVLQKTVTEGGRDSDGNSTRVSRNLAFAQRKKKRPSPPIFCLFSCVWGETVRKKKTRSTLVRA